MMNKLTERLLAEGYDEKHFPEYVKIPGGQKGGGALDNIYGGFEFLRSYAEERTYKAPCGVVAEGKNVIESVNQYCHENDQVAMVCPYRQKCEKAWLYQWCVAEYAEGEKANYEDVKKAEDAEKEREWQELNASGRLCKEHAKYKNGGWVYNYDPTVCGAGHCRATTVGDKCPVLGRELTREKGNVFYDIEYEGRDYSKDGTLFEGERYHYILKGLQLYDKPINYDIAKIIAKTCKDFIEFRVRYGRNIDAWSAFRAEKGLLDYSWKVINIRAEQKRTRDLDQDLADIDAGIEVIHAFDQSKKAKAEKTEKRKEATEKKRKRYKRTLKEKGLAGLDEFEERRMRKVLSGDEIEQIEREREEAENAPKQLSIFDYMEG